MPRVIVADSVASAFDVNLNKDCQCGRPNKFIHCPKCGSTNFYGLSGVSQQTKIPDLQGNLTAVRVFKCRSCITVFSEAQSSVGCTAQPTAAQEREVAHVTKAPPEAVSKLLREHKQAHPERYGLSVETKQEPTVERSPLDIADEERRLRRNEQ